MILTILYGDELVSVLNSKIRKFIRKSMIKIFPVSIGQKLNRLLKKSAWLIFTDAVNFSAGLNGSGPT